VEIDHYVPPGRLIHEHVVSNGRDRPVSNDVFAEHRYARHGGAARAARRSPPAEIAHKLLPAERSDPRAAFTPAPKIDTPEKLAAELARQRSRMSGSQGLRARTPFPEDTLRLEQFQWRLESGADRADFQHPLSGAGDWKAITVPHFGGPIGRAARTTGQPSP